PNLFLASDFSGWIWHSEGQNGTSMNNKLCKHVLNFENVLKSTPVNESRSPQS
ncbi:unnamed protein product, partial [Bubo scandiacus]